MPKGVSTWYSFKLRVDPNAVPAVLALNPQKKSKPRRMDPDADVSADTLMAFVNDYFGGDAGAGGAGAEKAGHSEL